MKTYEELGLPPILGERAIVLNADGADDQGYQEKVGHTGTVKEINSEYVRLIFETGIMYSFYRSEVGPVEQQSSQTKEKKIMNKTTYPHNILGINRVPINTRTLKRCEECAYGEEIQNLCGAHKCTVNIGETYSFNDGCNFEAMVKSERHILLVSEHLRLAFSEKGE